jgi:hypothetical protein
MRLDIRPRTTGEILDDAGRLALADAPLLLALNGLFTLPWTLALLAVLFWPTPPGPARLLWPALFATFIPLGGLGSAACQEVFRRRAEGKPVPLTGALGAALRRGLDHVAVRALLWGIVPVMVAAISAWLVGLVVLVLPGIFGVLWAIGLSMIALFLQSLFAGMAGLTSHAVLVGSDLRWWDAWKEAARQSQRQAGKVMAIVMTRPLLLLLTTFNLSMLVQMILSVGDQLAGLDLAVLEIILAPTNPIYDAAIVLVAWLLLTPFFEASNYLLYVDARARYEGLDLWYRVRRHFPLPAKAAGAALVLFALFFAASPALAADKPLPALRQVRVEIQAIQGEVKKAEPYRAARFTTRLSGLADRLDDEVSDREGRFRWFHELATAFAKQDRNAGLETLANMDQRLGLIEDGLVQAEEDEKQAGLTPDQVRALLPAERQPKVKTTTPDKKPAEPEKPPPVEEERPARRTVQVQGPRGPGLVGPQAGPGISSGTLYVLLGIVGALAIVGLVLTWQRRPATAAAVKVTKGAPAEPTLETLLTQNDRTVPHKLWKQADDLAAAGRFLEAVRMLYNAVLAQLHRADLIRYAPTRTNGDYVDEVRERSEIYMPFRGLTGLFEVKWYGEKSCRPDDYEACRRLAEQVRGAI